MGNKSEARTFAEGFLRSKGANMDAVAQYDDDTVCRIALLIMECMESESENVYNLFGKSRMRMVLEGVATIVIAFISLGVLFALQVAGWF